MIQWILSDIRDQVKRLALPEDEYMQNIEKILKETGFFQVLGIHEENEMLYQEMEHLQKAFVALRDHSDDLAKQLKIAKAKLKMKRLVFRKILPLIEGEV